MPGKHKWYRFRDGGRVPPLRRNEGGNIPATNTGIPARGYARPKIDAYLAGTNPMSADYSGKITRHIPEQHVYADLYTPPAVVTDDDSGDTDVVDTTYTGPVDDAGVPAPYLGVDEYDTEGDDNFLSQDEYNEQLNIITDQYDSWEGDGYDPTKTFEEQLSEEDYEDFYNSSLGENPAQTAADTIYNNNQQIYGEETGNNVTSLVTGNVTGLDKTGIEELQSADDDTTWAGDSSPVSQLINDQTSNYQDQVTSGAVPAFDINDQSTWVVPATEEPTIIDKVSDGVSNVVDSAAGLVSGGGDDGVGNLGAVGDFFGGIGDALGITDYAGEAEAAAQAEAEAQAAAEAKAAEEAAAAEAAAEAQRQADAEVARQVAEREAAAAAEAERKRQAAAAEAERQRIAAEQEAARIAAEEEAARIAAEEAAAAESNITEDGEIDWDSQQTTNAQELLAAGEIDFVEYLNQIGYYDTVNSGIDLGFQVGIVGGTGSTGHSQSPATDTGYVASDGPVHTTTGQHTVENEMDGATAVENWKAANNNNDDGPHMTHDEIIAHHEALNKAETDLIQSDLSDDDFWEAYDDDDGGGDSGGGGGGGGWSYGCYVGTALAEKGLWSDMQRLKLISWCQNAMPEGKFLTKLWRNGYCVFGKEAIAPRAEKFKWVSDGFYDGTVKRKRNIKALIGMGFYFIPSIAIGLFKWATGNLVEIDRT